MAINDDLLYEVDERGERVVVKSLESTSRAYIRFSNKTNRPVNVWWRDFNGIRQSYHILDPGEHYDVNTFITHPWEFTDVLTDEVYMINNRPVFRAPPNIGGMMYRTNWNISVGMRTLRHSALLAIATSLSHTCHVHKLELPRGLEMEVLELVAKHTRPYLPGD